MTSAATVADPVTTAASAPTTPRVRTEPDHISPAFFRATFATLGLGAVLCAAVFGIVSWHGSVAQGGPAMTAVEATTGP